ncbi:LamG domain-containing protein [Streptomyces hyaluromycini]|uniref:LamG domain-containing protein n=1 Tax=Streptomyces hyaluromycini TaxID=1377993 RepID=UPI00142D9598|nr:LamG domain-containing protein [Streptomyces hyaluromycini]
MGKPSPSTAPPATPPAAARRSTPPAATPSPRGCNSPHCPTAAPPSPPRTAPRAAPYYLPYDCTDTSSPQWAFTFANTDTANPDLTAGDSTTAATANTWTHLVGTYDATTKTAQLYLNGSLAATATGVTSWNAANAFTIGRSLHNGTNNDFFPGLISTVQAWNYALTPKPGHRPLPSNPLAPPATGAPSRQPGAPTATSHMGHKSC